MSVPRIRPDGPGRFMIAAPYMASDGSTVYQPRGPRAVYTYKTMRNALRELRHSGGIVLAWDPQLLPVVTPDDMVTPLEIDRMSWEEFCERQTTLWGQLAERARSEPRPREPRRRRYLHLDQDAPDE
ncbi:MAG TPA: hypothetical protein VF488_04950 [Gemmatimonadaceae bacterium]